MPDAKPRTVDSITKARSELDRALAELDAIRPYDPAAIGLVAHAMSPHATVTATVKILELTLRDRREANTPIWLDGIAHVANLMQHFVGRLVKVAAPGDSRLKPDYINLQMLMHRACEYYRRRAAAQDVPIALDTSDTLPLVWADRVTVDAN
jgi:C4-dicarboxylate-specific signal transduction histidine kinase